MSCAFATWLWLFYPGSTVGFGSRKEILVDRAGDMQSIFEKIRYNSVGKVVINKAPAGHASPNRADSLMIAFAPVVSSGFSIIGFLDDDGFTELWA
jgi:hypothetical protein